MLDTVTKWQFDFIRWGGGGIFNILLSVYLEMQKWRALYSDYKRYRPPIKTQGRPAEAEETLRKNMSQEEKKGGICSQQLWHKECLKIPRCLIALCLNCSQCDQIDLSSLFRLHTSFKSRLNLHTYRSEAPRFSLGFYVACPCAVFFPYPAETLGHF